jgi:hemolysin-activating ACP:hemolysin acyltransferase
MKSMQIEGSNQLLGSMCRLMAQNTHYEGFLMGDLTRLFIPPVELGQVVIFRDKERFAGFLTYAFLSDDVETALVNRERLIQPSDWTSGSSIWIMDAVLETGNLRKVKHLIFHAFQDHARVRYVRRKKDGSISRSLEFIKQDGKFVLKYQK